MPKPYTRTDLDSKQCGTPGCTATHEDGPIVLTGRCHIGAPSRAAYQNGVLSLECSICGTPTASVAVALASQPDMDGLADELVREARSLLAAGSTTDALIRREIAGRIRARVKAAG